VVALLKFITLKLDNIPSRISVCVAGTALVTYGMLKDDNPIFIIGIVVVRGICIGKKETKGIHPQ
jgi:hypothetical protein